jgi:hypothetical protein
MKLRALIAAISLLSTPAMADVHRFSNGEAVTVQPDQGYVLVRTFQFPGGRLSGTAMLAPIFVRVLSDDEVTQARALATADPDRWQDKIESNVVEPFADKPYALVGNEEYLLVALKPGTYILGGAALTNWIMVSSGIMTTSLCMGTVKFEVKPGVITDLGAVLGARDDLPTDIPELSGVVMGKPIGSEARPFTLAIRPGAQDVPAALSALPRVPADYRAVGAMPNYSGAPLSRLAPLPGVLDYDKDGNVIDLKAGAAP